jgi:DNA-binding PadR family transcriptional regulator
MNRSLLTDFELMILLATMRVGPGAYGVPIAREIEQTGGRPVALAAVYAALDRLERHGLVTSTRGEATPERGGRARKEFEVTREGLRAVKLTQEALVNLWTGIPQLKGRRV